MTAPLRPAARPASTVALLGTDARGRASVLMTHRPATMAFGPGLHVFPGGGVEATDREPVDGGLAHRSAVDADGCARAWAGDLAPLAALGHAVAAVRELYEEAGILLARHRDGSKVEPAVVAGAVAAGEPLASLAQRLDLVLATDQLAPLSRWVTPPTRDVTRRYDTRFYVADLPPGGAVSIDAREVIAHEWITPREALEAWTDRRIELWPPTSGTLLQLGSAGSAGDIGRRRRPLGPAPAPVVESVAPDVRSCRLGAAGGVPGAVAEAWIVGRQRVVVVDPGDPGEEALDALLAATIGSGRTLGAVVLTSAFPERAAGAVGLAMVAGVPLLASGRAAALVGSPCEAVEDGTVIDAGDVPLKAKLRRETFDGVLELEAPGLLRRPCRPSGTPRPSRTPRP